MYEHFQLEVFAPLLLKACRGVCSRLLSPLLLTAVCGALPAPRDHDLRPTGVAEASADRAPVAEPRAASPGPGLPHLTRAAPLPSPPRLPPMMNIRFIE
eukprot:1061318-Rhodomonas_salina.1